MRDILDASTGFVVAKIYGDTASYVVKTQGYLGFQFTHVIEEATQFDSLQSISDFEERLEDDSFYPHPGHAGRCILLVNTITVRNVHVIDENKEITR